jgi:hypothetical protein
MFKKMLYFGFALVFSEIVVSAMDGCDYKYLNERVRAYTMAISEKQEVTQEHVAGDLQFLSQEAAKPFEKSVQGSFDDTYKQVDIVHDTKQFVDICRAVYNSGDPLKKVQVWLLMSMVLSELSSGASNISGPFD